MRLLLDTHAALFWWAGSARLSEPAKQAIVDPKASVFVSSVTALEIATKFRLGKLDEIGDPSDRYPALMHKHGFEELCVTTAHSLRAGALPGPHRDPFDRLIAAQALLEGLTVVTRDREIAAFGCETLW